MNVDVLVAFVKDPGKILEVADRVAAIFQTIPEVRWTMTALVADSVGAFEQAAEAASQRPKLGAALFPDEQTLWCQATENANPEADIVVILDSATDSPDDIPALVAEFESASVGAVVGVRPVPPAKPTGIDGLLTETVTGGAVADLTSTLRAFRAPLVRFPRLKGSEADIPAALTAAVTAQGFRVVEVPVVGDAPAQRVPSGFGFSLFREGLTTRYALIALLLFVAGLGVFFLSSYPAHQYIADSDGVISGLCAVDVLKGKHWAFFPSGYRLGSHSCYLGAAMVSVMGQTRETLGAITLVYIAVALTFVYLAIKVAFGRLPALFGLLAFAFPPLQYVFFIEPPWGYGEIIACSAITWWFGFVLLFRPNLRSGGMSLLFGLALGLTFWTSPQTLMLTGPLMLVMMGLRVFSLKDLVLVAAGFVTGLWAYIYTILTKGLDPFLNNFATKPVNTLQQLLSNVHYLFTNVMPIFFLDSGLPPRTPLQGFQMLLLVTAGVCTVVIAWKWLAGKGANRPDPRTGIIALLTIGLFAATCLLFVTSSAGSVRGWTPRYLAPLIFILPLMAANLYTVARHKSVAMVAAVSLVAYSIGNAATYRFAGHPERESQAQALALKHRRYDWLRSKDRTMVLGDFWKVYGLNFGFGKGMDGIPVPLFIDYTFLLKQRIAEGKPVRLALVHAHEPSLGVWALRAGLRGHVEPIDAGLFAFLVDDEVSPTQVEAVAAQFR